MSPVLAKDLTAACIYASTAASFAIEQRGLPRFRMENGEEQWNDVNVRDRLDDLMMRVFQH